jgi:hypothetical protein
MGHGHLHSGGAGRLKQRQLSRLGQQGEDTRVRVRGIFSRGATEKGIAQMKATWIAASQRHPQKNARIHAALALGQRNVFRAG